MKSEKKKQTTCKIKKEYRQPEEKNLSAGHPDFREGNERSEIEREILDFGRPHSRRIAFLRGYGEWHEEMKQDRKRNQDAA